MTRDDAVGRGGRSGRDPERRLVGYDRVARRWLVASILLGVLAVVALLGQLLIVAFVIEAVFIGGGQLADVLPLLATAAVLVLARALLAGLGDVAARRSAERLVGRLREDLTGRLLTLGPAWLGRERSGELAGALIGGLEAIDEYVTTYLPARWLAMIVPFLVLALVFVLDPPSVVVLLFTGPLLLLLLAVIGGRTRAITERRFLEMRLLAAFFLDLLRGLATLKLFGRSSEQVETLRRVSTTYGETTMEVLRVAFQTSLVLEWGATIAIALVAVEIGLRLLVDGIAFDRALAVLLVTPEFFLPLRLLAVRYHLGTAGKTAAARTFEIVDPVPSTAAAAGEAAVPGATEAPAEARVAGSPPRPAASEPPRIRLTGVTVRYPGRAVAALDDVTFELEPGRTLALVGPSGAGKSTVVNLLLRFIEAEAGVIEVDGRPLAHVPADAWRASLAWVPQRPHLFEGSVADNIRLARPEATDGAVIAAARAADASEFIERLPHGYESTIGAAGARLSGGQRQRLAIARAFLRDAPFLVLDEPTSYLDDVGEGAIAAALHRLMTGRTVLVIAHRLRLAEQADRVVVLDGGRVVEVGSPSRLLAGESAWRRMLEGRPAILRTAP